MIDTNSQHDNKRHTKPIVLTNSPTAGQPAPQKEGGKCRKLKASPDLSNGYMKNYKHHWRETPTSD